MKNLVLILAASFAIGAQASTRVNNGMMNFSLIYSCNEVNPVDSKNPYIAVLRTSEDGPLLTVRRMYSGTEYSGLVTQINKVRCVLACDVRENTKDKVGFAVTNLGSYLQGIYSSPSNNITFKCNSYGK